MDLRRLRYFVAVAEQEHFGLAARAINVAQPALSRQIQQLEAELELQLFERLPRGVRLTEAGRHLLRSARQILADYERAITEARRVAKGQWGALRLGFIEVSGWQGTVPTAISRFRELAPALQLGVHALSSPDQIAAIRNGTLDGGFLYNGPNSDPHLQSIGIANHGIFLAVPVGHSLAHRTSINLRETTHLPLIWFARDKSIDFHDDLVRAIDSSGAVRNIVHEADSESVMLTLVNSGMGVAFINEGQRWRLPKGVRLLPVDDLDVRLRLGFFWRSANNNPALESFRAILQSGSS